MGSEHMTGKPCVVVREMSKRPAAAVVLAELMEDAAARNHAADRRRRAGDGALAADLRLLVGYRGAPVCDVEAVHDVLLRLSALVEAHAEVAELDLDPLGASPSGAVMSTPVCGSRRRRLLARCPHCESEQPNARRRGADRAFRPTGRAAGRTHR
jgi:hypothetical protein